MNFKLIAIAACLPFAAFASDDSGWTFQRMSSLTGVPETVLQGSLCAESLGAPGSEKCVLWPWTLRIAGALKHYDNRQQAELALREALDLGISHIDVGLMQVNWRRYHHHLVSPEQALDPIYNLRVGVDLLQTETDPANYSGTTVASVDRHSEPRPASDDSHAGDWAETLLSFNQTDTDQSSGDFHPPRDAGRWAD